MSLLKGIVFIPRERKVEPEIISGSNDRDKKRKPSDHVKKKKEDKHKKHKKESHHKSSREKQKERDTSSEDDDDYKDFGKYKDDIKVITEEEDRTKNEYDEWDYQKEGHESNSERTSSVTSNRTTTSSSAKQSNSKFSSLLGSLTAGEIRPSTVSASGSESRIAGNRHTDFSDDCSTDNRDSSYSDNTHSSSSSILIKSSDRLTESSELYSSGITREEHSNTVTDPPKKEISSNQSMAELFRSRLKKSKGSLKPDITLEEEKSGSNSGSAVEGEGQGNGDILYEDSTSIRDQMINKLRATTAVNEKHANSGSSSERNKNTAASAATKGKDYALNNAQLSLLMKSEKFGGNDMDENFRENVFRLGKNYKGNELGVSGAFGNGNLTGADEEEEIDMKMFENKHEIIEDVKMTKKQTLKNLGGQKRNNNENEKVNDRQREIIDRCPHCTEGASYKSYLTVSKGEHTMLRLKTGTHTLGPGHCIITPIMHCSSFLKCEEEVAVEVTRYKSCLRRMYEKNGQTVLFLESALQFGKHPHARIDVVPVPLGIESEARMCFREVLVHKTPHQATVTVCGGTILICFYTKCFLSFTFPSTVMFLVQSPQSECIILYPLCPNPLTFT